MNTTGRPWAAVAIVIALLVLAGSIIYAGWMVKSTVRGGMARLEGEMSTAVIEGLQEGVAQEFKDELLRDARREVLAAIHAYRRGAQEGRELTQEDIEAGYEFADRYLETR